MKKIISAIKLKTSASPSTQAPKRARRDSREEETYDSSFIHPLYRAAFLGNLEEIRSLLATGVNPNQTGYGKGTALMAAARNSQTKAVSLLLESGANPDQRDTNQRTALFYAAESRDFDITKVLLEAGASADVFDEDNITPLACSFFGNRDWNQELSKCLKEHNGTLGLEQFIGNRLITGFGDIQLGAERHDIENKTFETDKYQPIVAFASGNVCYIEVCELSYRENQLWVMFLFNIPFVHLAEEFQQLDSEAIVHSNDGKIDAIASPKVGVYLSSGQDATRPPARLGIFDPSVVRANFNDDAITLIRIETEEIIDIRSERMTLEQPQTPEEYLRYIQAVVNKDGEGLKKDDPAWETEDDVNKLFQAYMKSCGKGVEQLFTPFQNSRAFIDRIMFLYQITDSRTQAGLKQGWMHSYFHTEESQRDKDFGKKETESLETLGQSYIENLKELANILSLDGFLEEINKIEEIKVELKVKNRFEELLNMLHGNNQNEDDETVEVDTSIVLEALSKARLDPRLDVLDEAYYSIANDYELGFYFCWPAFSHVCDTDVFHPVMELWRKGFLCEFRGKLLIIKRS